MVFKLSRFGHNAADVFIDLNAKDAGFRCEPDLRGRLNRQLQRQRKADDFVLSSVAEIERENILVKTMEGRRKKAREGKWNVGFATYDYKLVDGEQVSAEDEAELIRLIFDKYINTTMGVNGCCMAEPAGIPKEKMLEQYTKCVCSVIHQGRFG